MTTAEPSCRDDHKTLECVCQRCQHNVDAICPQCRSELGPDSVLTNDGERLMSQKDYDARIATLVSVIMKQKHKGFWWACFMIATGQADASGFSMGALGDEFGVGKACVSKTCIAICTILGRPPSRHMRDEAARESYRQSNTTGADNQQRIA